MLIALVGQETIKADRCRHSNATLMAWTPPDDIDVPRWWCLATTMEASMGQVSTIGLDIAKRVIGQLDLFAAMVHKRGLVDEARHYLDAGQAHRGGC